MENYPWPPQSSLTACPGAPRPGDPLQTLKTYSVLVPPQRFGVLLLIRGCAP